jgi:cytochrome c oxidase cbb3-type subunit 3
MSCPKGFIEDRLKSCRNDKTSAMKLFLRKPLKTAVLTIVSVVMTMGFPFISSAADGKKLYLDNCASCHGTEGEGGKGLALNRQGFLSVATDVYIVRSIFYGRPTRGCPPRRDLSREEMTSMASFIKSWQKVESITVPGYNVQPAPSERGKEIFNVCVGCHDVGGVGAMGPSLIDPGFLASASDAFLRGTIMHGREGTPMPGFSKGKGRVPGLSDEDIDELIAYIRYLGR